jgi:hypothetical protein
MPAPAQLGDAVLAAQAFQHDADLLLGREVPAGRARISFTTRSAGALASPDVCFIFAPDGYDEPDILRSRIALNLPHKC